MQEPVASGGNFTPGKVCVCVGGDNKERDENKDREEHLNATVGELIAKNAKKYAETPRPFPFFP